MSFGPQGFQIYPPPRSRMGVCKAGPSADSVRLLVVAGGGAGAGLEELPCEMVGSGVGRTRRAYVPRPDGAGRVPSNLAPNFDLGEIFGAGLRDVTSGRCALARLGLTYPLDPMLEIELGVPHQAPLHPSSPPVILPRRRLWSPHSLRRWVGSATSSTSSWRSCSPAFLLPCVSLQALPTSGRPPATVSALLYLRTPRWLSNSSFPEDTHVPTSISKTRGLNRPR